MQNVRNKRGKLCAMIPLVLLCLSLACILPQSAMAETQNGNKDYSEEVRSASASLDVDLVKGVTSGPYTLAASQEAVFSFSSAGPARMAFIISQSNDLASGNSIQASVEDSNGNKLYEWNISHDTTNVIFGDFVVGSGNYFIRMKANCNISNLSIKMNIDNTDNKYGVEIEPNNSLETATRLELGKDFFGSIYDPANEVYTMGQLIGLHDNDCYRFSLNEDSDFELIISNEAGVHYELGTVNEEAKRTGDLNSGTTTISGDLPAGEYYLMIQGGNSAWGKTYSAKINAKASKASISSLRLPYMSYDESTYDGQEKKPVPIVKSGSKTLEVGKDYTVRYESNINVGTAKVIVDGIGNYKGQLIETFDIEPKSITADMISIPEQYYTGKPIAPAPIIRHGNTVLEEGKDYKIVSYKNNTDTGYMPSVTIQGIGNYERTTSQYFRIKKHNLSEANITIADQTYTGRHLWPNPTVKIDGTTLKNDIDYFVAYDNNQSIGIASATIYGRGTYEGFVTVNFKIKGPSVWKKSGNRWWYQNSDGSYPKNCSMTINGAVYRFDNDGWMRKGWINESGKWYYHNGSGAMVKGWAKIGGKWYYLNPSDGVMKTGFYDVGKNRYYSNASGAMQIGWKQIDRKWYYFKGSGAMTTGWQKVKGSWYYLNPVDGKMATGKQVIGGKTYFFKSSGAMKTGWNQEGSKWYYYDGAGAMKTNAWISGKYWVGPDGIMATNTWVDGDKYYVNAKGEWVKGATH